MMPKPTVTFRGETCEVFSEGKIVSYGQVLGKYCVFGYQGASLTRLVVFNNSVVTFGEYSECKYDVLAKIVFVELAINDNSGVIAIDVSPGFDNTSLVVGFNRLYTAMVNERLPVAVGIFDSMVIAWQGDSTALVNRIVETPDEFSIYGLKDEKLVIPRPRNQKRNGVVHKEVLQPPQEIVDLDFVDIGSAETHRFEIKE